LENDTTVRDRSDPRLLLDTLLGNDAGCEVDFGSAAITPDLCRRDKGFLHFMSFMSLSFQNGHWNLLAHVFV
jgi:hypothetical protein